MDIKNYCRSIYNRNTYKLRINKFFEAEVVNIFKSELQSTLTSKSTYSYFIGNLKLIELDSTIGDDASVYEKMLSHTLHFVILSTSASNIRSFLCIFNNKLLQQLEQIAHLLLQSQPFRIELNFALLSIDNMQQHSTRRSTNKSRGLELHSVLREFKKFEEQKQILQNRINIMHNNHVKNTNKARTIEDHLQKIKKAQKGRKQEQQSINRQINEQATQQVEKKKQKVRRIKQQKKNIETSKKIYKQYLLKNVRKVRSESKINRQKIASGKQLALLSNRKRKQEINMSEELCRTKVSIFKNNKICSFKQQQNQRLLQQIQLNQSSRSQLQVLQKLQKEMVMKYSQSIRSLKSSRANMKRISLMRG